MMKHGNLSKLLALMLVLAQLLCALPAFADEVSEAPEALFVELGEAPEAAESDEEPADGTEAVETETTELPEVAEVRLEAEDVEADAEAPAEELTEMIGDAADIEEPEVAEDDGEEDMNLTFVIHFDANGGKGKMDSMSVHIDSNPEEQPARCFVPPACEFTNSGNVFVAWSNSPSPTENQLYYFPGQPLDCFDVFSIAGSQHAEQVGNTVECTLYAIWVTEEVAEEGEQAITVIRTIMAGIEEHEPVFGVTAVELFVGEERQIPIGLYWENSEIIEANSPEFVACPENKVESFLEYGGQTLTSDDESIATIDKTGKVTAKKVGKTFVRIEYEEKQPIASGVGDHGEGYIQYTPWCLVIVKAKNPTGVKLNPASLTLARKGATATLKATVLPEGTTSKLTWTSSDAKVATVDRNGKVTAVAPGVATVTVNTANGKKATCKVTVRGITPASKTVSVKVKKTLKLQSLIKTFGFKTSKLTWTSANAKIAKVDKKTGVVTGVKAGNTTKITGKCTVGGATYKVVFTVKVKANAEGNIKLN